MNEVAKFMELNGLSAGELARRLGKPPRTVQGWAFGRKRYGIEVVLLLQMISRYGWPEVPDATWWD